MVQLLFAPNGRGVLKRDITSSDAECVDVDFGSEKGFLNIAVLGRDEPHDLECWR